MSPFSSFPPKMGLAHPLRDDGTMVKMLEIPRKKYSIETCNTLLEHERLLVEHCNTAVDKLDAHSRLGDLLMIRDTHRQSVTRLERYIISLGGQPTISWKKQRRKSDLSIKLPATTSPLLSLIQAEKNCLAEYLKASKDSNLLTECVDLLSGELIPRIESHLELLSELNDLRIWGAGKPLPQTAPLRTGDVAIAV